MFQLREKLFDKLDLFNFAYSDDQKLFRDLAIFDFDSICVQEDKFRDTKITTWIVKHVPISVSISSNLIDQHIFLCNSNPGALVESFVDALEALATQSKAQMRLKSLAIETNVKSKLNQIFSASIQRRCRREPVLDFEDACIGEEKERESTQLLKTQKKQPIDLQDHLERYCYVFPVFGFNIAKYDLKNKKKLTAASPCYWTRSWTNGDQEG